MFVAAFRRWNFWRNSLNGSNDNITYNNPRMCGVYPKVHCTGLYPIDLWDDIVYCLNPFFLGLCSLENISVPYSARYSSIARQVI